MHRSGYRSFRRLQPRDSLSTSPRRDKMSACASRFMSSSGVSTRSGLVYITRNPVGSDSKIP
ncbi:hypothetical protein BJX65DRAFT_276124 [Aspergillus insuetus]